MARTSPAKAATGSSGGLVRHAGRGAAPATDTADAIAARLRVAAALVRLDDLAIEAITVAGRAQLGLPTAAIIGRSILDIVAPVERDHARAAMQAIQSGAIDFYRAERARLVTNAGGTVWARKLWLGGEAYVLAAWFGVDRDRDRPIRAAAGQLFGLTLAVGIADRDGVVASVSVDETHAPRLRPEALIGRRLYGPDQERGMLSIRREAGLTRTGSSVAFSIDIPEAAAAGYELVCVLAALAGTDDRLFLVLGMPTQAGGREAELESHLWRIAAEVESSGILLRVGRDPVLGLARSEAAAGLSPRQWDILRRLVNGDRVPTIAAELFLSPSTVRGHLSAIFDRFDVHSQAELLARLRDTSMETSGPSS